MEFSKEGEGGKKEMRIVLFCLTNTLLHPRWMDQRGKTHQAGKLSFRRNRYTTLVKLLRIVARISALFITSFVKYRAIPA